MSASKKDALEKARLAYWNSKKQHVTELLQRILDENYQGKGAISENWVLPFYGRVPTLPNLAMTPDVPHMNLGRLVVSAKCEEFFTLFKMTYSSGRYVVRLSVHESRLYEWMLLVIGTFLYPDKKKEDR